MQTFKIKPAKGMTVIDPATMKPLPEDGATMPRNSFWLRRLEDNEIEVVQEKPAKPSKATKESN